MASKKHRCIQCSSPFPESNFNRKYCSAKCKKRWRKLHGPKGKVRVHKCRTCGKVFEITSGQGNKWLCSASCRRASVAKSVRTFHERRPDAEPIYRARTKAKNLPEDNLTRFLRTNPKAPRKCESCGEDRVLDVAHKPHSRRYGAWRSSKNCRWPEMVWVLCPTCHALVDRMHYPPEELGLKL